MNRVLFDDLVFLFVGQTIFLFAEMFFWV